MCHFYGSRRSSGVESASSAPARPLRKKPTIKLLQRWNTNGVAFMRVPPCGIRHAGPFPIAQTLHIHDFAAAGRIPPLPFIVPVRLSQITSHKLTYESRFLPHARSWSAGSMARPVPVFGVILFSERSAHRPARLTRPQHFLRPMKQGRCRNRGSP